MITNFYQFEQCDLHPVMKENIALARYTTPTPVQVHKMLKGSKEKVVSTHNLTSQYPHTETLDSYSHCRQGLDGLRSNG